MKHLILILTLVTLSFSSFALSSENNYSDSKKLEEKTVKFEKKYSKVNLSVFNQNLAEDKYVVSIGVEVYDKFIIVTASGKTPRQAFRRARRKLAKILFG